MKFSYDIKRATSKRHASIRVNDNRNDDGSIVDCDRFASDSALAKHPAPIVEAKMRTARNDPIRPSSIQDFRLGVLRSPNPFATSYLTFQRPLFTDVKPLLTDFRRRWPAGSRLVFLSRAIVIESFKFLVREGKGSIASDTWKIFSVKT